MKRGMLSFAVAAIVILVLFYVAAISISLRDRQVIALQRLSGEIVAERYVDAIKAYDATVLDAIVDAAYDSSRSGNCRAPAAPYDYPTSLANRMELYLNRTTDRLDGDGARVSYGYNDTMKVWLQFRDLGEKEFSEAPPCGTDLQINMTRFVTFVSFAANVTSLDGQIGYKQKMFSYAYDVFLNRSVNDRKNYTIKITPENQWASNRYCIQVNDCPVS